MKWTTTTPTEEGWYWMDDALGPPMMVRVEDWGDGGMTAHHFAGRCAWDYVDKIVARWYGPLLPPEAER